MKFQTFFTSKGGLTASLLLKSQSYALKYILLFCLKIKIVNICSNRKVSNKNLVRNQIWGKITSDLQYSWRCGKIVCFSRQFFIFCSQAKQNWCSMDFSIRQDVISAFSAKVFFYLSHEFLKNLSSRHRIFFILLFLFCFAKFFQSFRY
jgi:hypothetical protein